MVQYEILYHNCTNRTINNYVDRKIINVILYQQYHYQGYYLFYT